MTRGGGREYENSGLETDRWNGGRGGRSGPGTQWLD